MARSLTKLRAVIACASLVACAAVPLAHVPPAFASNLLPEDTSSSPDDDLSLKRDANYPAGTAVYYVLRTTISDPDAHKVSTFLNVAIAVGDDGVSVVSPISGKYHITTSRNVRIFTDVEKVYVPPGSVSPTVYPGRQPDYVISR